MRDSLACACTCRQQGHFDAAGVPIKRRLTEFRVTPDALLPLGTLLNAAHFTPGQFVDVQGELTGSLFHEAHIHAHHRCRVLLSITAGACELVVALECAACALHVVV